MPSTLILHSPISTVYNFYILHSLHSLHSTLYTICTLYKPNILHSILSILSSLYILHSTLYTLWTDPALATKHRECLYLSLTNWSQSMAQQQIKSLLGPKVYSNRGHVFFSKSLNILSFLLYHHLKIYLCHSFDLAYRIEYIIFFFNFSTFCIPFFWTLYLMSLPFQPFFCLSMRFFYERDELT